MTQLNRNCTVTEDTENLNDYFNQLTLVGRVWQLKEFFKQLKIEFYYVLLEDSECEEIYYRYLFNLITIYESKNKGLTKVFQKYITWFVKLKINITEETWLLDR